MSGFQELWRPIWKAVRAAALLLGHLLIGGAVVLTAEGLERFILYVRHGRPWVLFDRVPVSCILDGFDLFALLLLTFWGLVEANRLLRGH